MDALPVPLREQVEMPQCRCLLTGIDWVARCPDRTESPDDPLCALCRAIHLEKQEHFTLVTWSMAR